MMLSFGFRGKIGLCHKGLEAALWHGHSRLASTVPKSRGRPHDTVEPGSVHQAAGAPPPAVVSHCGCGTVSEILLWKLFWVSQSGLGSGENPGVLGPQIQLQFDIPVGLALWQWLVLVSGLFVRTTPRLPTLALHSTSWRTPT